MIYIQSRQYKGYTIPHHFDCSCAMYGAEESAMDFRLTTFEEVASGKFDNLIRTNVFVGSVEFMREVFKRVGLHDVRLPKNSNRAHSVITLGEAHRRVAAGEKLFIKPIEIKLFTGLVLDGFDYSCLHGLPDDTMVMAYDAFRRKITTEWRIYIKDGEIVDSRNYAGDFTIMPNYKIVPNWIDWCKNNKFPRAYTIDVAVLEADESYIENVVVEFNDMWAIGNYGLPNDLYLYLLISRYFEIVENIDKQKINTN